MASQPCSLNTSTCQFKKENGEFCKRSVTSGEGRCWQHARSWRHKWRSLTRNQTVVFSLTVLAIVLGVPSLYYSYLGSRSATVRPLHPAEQADKSEQALRIYVAQFIPSGAMRFWSVRNDVKQYFPTDIFMLMRFTNLTKEEIQFDSVNVEIALKSNRPFKLFLLAADDNSWHTYCGLNHNFCCAMYL
jgi:hypothetical protein